MTHKYIGTKEVLAWVQDRAQKQLVCGVDCKPGDAGCNGFCEGKASEAPAAPVVEGYAVSYPDGYVSWSPKAVFEAAYRTCDGDDQKLNFGDAIHFLKEGRLVARKGWNGKGMWLGYCSNWNGNVQPNGPSFRLLPFIYMRTAQGDIVPWLASQTDMLAEDWMVLAPAV